MPQVSDRIRRMRKQKNMTLAEVARHLGVQEATVQRYESGEIKTIKPETLYKLAQLLQCDPQWLMGWDSAKFESNPKNTNSNNQTITNSTVVSGNNSSAVILQGRDGSLELTEQTAALVRVFNSMTVKGQTMLLARAYELEDLYNKKEDEA